MGRFTLASPVREDEVGLSHGRLAASVVGRVPEVAGLTRAVERSLGVDTELRARAWYHLALVDV